MTRSETDAAPPAVLGIIGGLCYPYQPRGHGPAAGSWHPDGSRTMTKIQIELPDATAKAARDAGLLTPQALDRLFTDAIRRRQAADSLLSIADRVAAAGIGPMSMEEIDAEVKTVRAKRRQRAGRH